MYTTTLLAGERSGNLQEVLERYVSFQKVSLAFRKKLTASLIYPALLMTLVIGLMVFLLTVVVPQFAMLYDEMGSKLPPMTLALLAFGTWTQRNILWIALMALIVGVVGYRFSLTERGRDFVDGFRVGLPVFGKIWLKYQVALFCAHAFHAADRRIAAGAVARNGGAVHLLAARFRRPCIPSIDTVREGKSLADSLTKTEVFPDLAAEMITVGEQTGALPQMLNSVAEFFEEDVATALTASLALIEPAILIVMGVVVVFILISLYLPIFSLGQAGGRSGG